MDTIGGEFGEQSRVPDRIEGTLYVKGDSSDIMFGIKDLHPLLRQQKQHLQSRMTGSESKLMIRDQAIGEEERFDVRSD